MDIFYLQDFKNWEPKRVGALLLYIFAVMFSCQRIYVAIRAPFLDQEKRQLTEAYMEALIPEPTPINIRKYSSLVFICKCNLQEMNRTKF